MLTRFASLLLAATALAPTSANSAPLSQAVLATPDQLTAERRALKAIEDPRVQASIKRARAALATDPAAGTEEGKASLDHALTLWLHSLALREAASDTSRPIVVWEVDDTPHSWFGHTIPGSGVAGDNPDNIYRGTYLDGGSRYEIWGHVPNNGPAQFSLEGVVGEPGKIVLTTLGKGHVDMGNQLRLIRDVDVTLDANHDFVVTVDSDPANGRPNHIQSRPGPLSVVLRNSLSDWTQTPTAFTVRRLDDKPAGPVLTVDALAQHIANDLPGWVDAWTKFKEGWLGSPPANTLAGPLPRDGGWGFAAGGQYDLKDDEALIITTRDGGAKYTGFQVLDRWFMAADSRHAFTSRNNGQVKANPDGTIVYVVALKDPGVANWIDPAGFHQGFVNIRWQQTPANIDAKSLLVETKLVKLSELGKSVSDVGSVTPAQRASQLRERAKEYESRLVN
nr:A35 [uncultured bacterium]